MNATPLMGKLVRLAAPNHDEYADLMSRWSEDGELMRLLNAEPAMIYQRSEVQKWIDKNDGEDMVYFTIRTLAEDKLIGSIELDGFSFDTGNCWLGIYLGERDYWGQGYGTDAMRVLLHYAFTELGIRRVTLNVFEYNQRAIKSYQKAGFKIEGVGRKALLRAGKRWEMIYMGILRKDWQELQELEEKCQP
jgi:RimJ/RimL family protein N-acetyltransferase